MTNSFCKGDLLIVKQAAIAFGFGQPNEEGHRPACMKVLQKPKIAVCLGSDSEANIIRVLFDDNKWSVKSKDCAHYSKQFKLEEA